MPSRFEIDDRLWAEIESLIPPRQRRFRYPGRKPIPDRLALNGILHVLHTGIAWDWSDNGDGGRFSTSAAVRGASYIAPVNAVFFSARARVTMRTAPSRSTLTNSLMRSP